MCGCGKLTVRKNKKQQKLTLALIQKRKTQLANKKKLNEENKLTNTNNDNFTFNPTPGLIGQTTAQVRTGGMGVRKIRRNKRRNVRNVGKGMKLRK